MLQSNPNPPNCKMWVLHTEHCDLPSPDPKLCGWITYRNKVFLLYLIRCIWMWLIHHFHPASISSVFLQTSLLVKHLFTFTFDHKRQILFFFCPGSKTTFVFSKCLQEEEERCIRLSMNVGWVSIKLFLRFCTKHEWDERPEDNILLEWSKTNKANI